MKPTIAWFTLILALCALSLTGCSEPAGPVVNNSGDNNAINIAGDSEGDADNDVVTPAPVVVPPVIVTAPAEEGG